jgi:hypothetical protein
MERRIEIHGHVQGIARDLSSSKMVRGIPVCLSIRQTTLFKISIRHLSNQKKVKFGERQLTMNEMYHQAI